MHEENIQVYVSNNCTESNKLIHLLEELGVKHERKNVTENKDYMRELQQQKIYATPVAMVNNKKVLGYQKSRLMDILRHYV
ncbi:hypothetical protein GCM10011351_20300 [Paraliobacillus quinghaiensis]|uniref:Glutaredoxin domain-containing protein n=1 Tax=Paraliobacillus quinghaiensis TaxID=470815 RepID=A0A917TTA8_9BACI|nr:glutaredoxin domain-containing protein [Paraliobacillus quinghaiensis]GGM34250.1 hypothetical protein GCM10011351_20300 [Paraliobacillus quinghaiensis]